MSLEDFKLSEHFSFFELTVTSNDGLQDQNRSEAMKYLPSGKALATRILEPIRAGRALVVNSAFRSWTLNGTTPGSSPTSQHPLFQAADIHRPNQDMDEFFKEVLATLKDQKIRFGQLIDESARRSYGVTRWVHISLGYGFWKPERCGEVLRKWDDENGKPCFEMLEKVIQPSE